MKKVEEKEAPLVHVRLPTLRETQIRTLADAADVSYESMIYLSRKLEAAGPPYAATFGRGTRKASLNFDQMVSLAIATALNMPAQTADLVPRIMKARYAYTIMSKKLVEPSATRSKTKHSYWAPLPTEEFIHSLKVGLYDVFTVVDGKFLYAKNRRIDVRLSVAPILSAEMIWHTGGIFDDHTISSIFRPTSLTKHEVLKPSTIQRAGGVIPFAFFDVLMRLSMDSAHAQGRIQNETAASLPGEAAASRDQAHSTSQDRGTQLEPKGRRHPPQPSLKSRTGHSPQPTRSIENDEEPPIAD